MSRRRNAVGRARAARAALALAAALTCLGAAAYAANRDKVPSGGAEAAPAPQERPHGARSGQRPSRPRITAHPEAVDTRATARFAFRARDASLRFQCRLDRGPWRACRSPHLVRGLAAAPHSFSVRALRGSLRGPAARFRWVKVDPRPLTVEPRSTGLGALYPGGPAQPIPVRIANPNAVPVAVTSLTVAASATAPGCPADPNLELSPAPLSSSAPLVLPAGGEVTLPTANVAAPAIALRELPFNQDACKGTSFVLRLAAEGRG